MSILFFFNDTATTEIYTLSLHDALPISEELTSGPDCCRPDGQRPATASGHRRPRRGAAHPAHRLREGHGEHPRSEEHTSELQSRQYLVCRLLLEKKKKNFLVYIP